MQQECILMVFISCYLEQKWVSSQLLQRMGSRVSCWCLGSVWESSRSSALGPTLLLLLLQGRALRPALSPHLLQPCRAPGSCRALLGCQSGTESLPKSCCRKCRAELPPRTGAWSRAGAGLGLLPDREPWCHESALNVWFPSALISSLGIISAVHLRLPCTVLSTARDLESYCVDIPVIDTIVTTDLNCWDIVEMDFDLEVTRVLVILHVQLLPFCEMYEDLYFGSS